MYCEGQFKKWLFDFQKKYLQRLWESNLTDVQHKIFVFNWHDSRAVLAPDIEGSVLHSYTCADKILSYKLEPSINPNAEMAQKKFEDLAGLNLQPEHENTTLLLEIMKYAGRDVNLIEAFDLFTECHKKKAGIKDEALLRSWFLKALAELKYVGLVSATRQNTFLFKKNFYSKP